jgi:glycosyltransferase involved in cell wall biosynthesis
MPESIYKLKNDTVIPVGEVANAKDFVTSNDIMIVPIISGSGIRIKILEGMALGKPVIATTIAAEGLGLNA